jgi:hypothetical protein
MISVNQLVTIQFGKQYSILSKIDVELLSMNRLHTDKLTSLSSTEAWRHDQHPKWNSI